MNTEIVSVTIGPLVYCDTCNEDYTDSSDSGGFVFDGWAICPACEAKARAEIRRDGETRRIEACCPSAMSFGDFIRAYRLGVEVNGEGR